MNMLRGSSVAERARAVAREVAGRAAEAVDREAAFPRDAVQALRDARLMGCMAEPGLGGEGAAFREVAEACHLLGQHCASTAMVYAMHQIQLACLLHHRGASDWHRDLLAEAAGRQWLMASATTEGATGGDVRISQCAVEPAGGRVRIEKRGAVISYATEADAVLVTARRHPDAAPTDQVLCVARRGDLRLEETSGWDALGMRGTRSATYAVSVDALPDQVMPVPYAEISGQTMLPVSHLLWSALWLGIAAGALARAAAFLRQGARGGGGTTPPGARRLAEATAQLQATRAALADAIRRYEARLGDADALSAISFGVAMNGMKVTASTAAFGIVQEALLVCGFAGYRNDTPFSLGRHLRDAASAALMISNDRILGNTAGMVLAHRMEEGLFG